MTMLEPSSARHWDLTLDPQQPRIDGAEQQIPALGAGAQVTIVVQQPTQLRSGEVRRERQTATREQNLVVEFGRDGRQQTRGPVVLPHDRAVRGLAGVAVPHDGGLALVGDAERHDLARFDVGVGEGLRDDPAHDLPDLGRVVLDPARPRVVLAVFALRDRDQPAVVVVDDAAGGGRSLVERGDVALGHTSFRITKSFDHVDPEGRHCRPGPCSAMPNDG